MAKNTPKKATPAAQGAPVAAEPKKDEAPGSAVAGQAAPDITTAEAAAAPQGAGADAPAPGQEIQETETEALSVRTKARAGSRRRAGYVFTPEPYGIALNALTEEQIAAIESDPLLVVERTTFPDEAGE